MENLIIAVILIVILLIALNGGKKRLKKGCCGGESVRIKPRDRKKSNYKYEALVYMDGMSCENCKIRIENVFNELPDFMAEVNWKKKCVRVWSKKKISKEELSDIVNQKGYKFVKCVMKTVSINKI